MSTPPLHTYLDRSECHQGESDTELFRDTIHQISEMVRMNQDFSQQILLRT